MVRSYIATNHQSLWSRSTAPAPTTVQAVPVKQLGVIARTYVLRGIIEFYSHGIRTEKGENEKSVQHAVSRASVGRGIVLQLNGAGQPSIIQDASENRQRNKKMLLPNGGANFAADDKGNPNRAAGACRPAGRPTLPLLICVANRNGRGWAWQGRCGCKTRSDRTTPHSKEERNMMWDTAARRDGWFAAV